MSVICREFLVLIAAGLVLRRLVLMLPWLEWDNYRIGHVIQKQMNNEECL